MEYYMIEYKTIDEDIVVFWISWSWLNKTTSAYYFLFNDSQ